MPNGRRREWLLGRFAAKAAVSHLLARRGIRRVALSSIEILPDACGCPRVFCTTAKEHQTFGVTIAHADGHAAALAWHSDTGQTFGLDLEPGAKARAFLESAAVLHARERCLLPEGNRRQGWATRFWCAKEAAGKALGVGLAGGPHRFIVARADLESGDVRIEVSGSHSPTSVLVRTGENDGFVHAVAVL